MKIRGVIFDMDGTILNTLDDLAESINYALTSLNLPIKNKNEIKNIVGNGIETTIQRALSLHWLFYRL